MNKISQIFEGTGAKNAGDDAGGPYADATAVAVAAASVSWWS